MAGRRSDARLGGMAVLLEQFGGTTRVVELRVMGLHRASQARVTAIDA
jgi:hypothetical protein